MSLKAGILFNPHKPAIEKYLQTLKTKIICSGCELVFISSTEERHPDFSLAVDFLIVLGGDGSVLRSVNLTLKNQIPVVGINFGKFGFLTRFEIEEVLGDSFDFRNLQILPRLVLQVHAVYQKEERELYALNDIVIHRSLECNLEHYQIFIDTDALPVISGDGIILSTPTGSTAYSLSAGGSIIYPQAEVIQITLLAPHTMANTPLIVSDRTTIAIQKSPMNPFLFSIDGLPSEKAEKVEVKRSKWDFLLAFPPKDSLSRIITEKLLWGKRG